MKAALSLAVLLAAAPCRAGEAIAVMFSDRPPYLVPSVDGPPTGLTGAPAAQAFRAAGVEVTWSVLPTNRQLAMVKDEHARACALGWFRTPERERYAKFTKPIYRDKDWLLLARPGYTLPEGATLDSVLHTPGTRVMVKDNFSYGTQIDALMARNKPLVSISAGSVTQMLQSLSAGAADFIFVSEDEGRYLMANGGAYARKLQLLRPRDMPHGTERHIMCGRGVPDEVIEKLNKAITLK